MRKNYLIRMNCGCKPLAYVIRFYLYIYIYGKIWHISQKNQKMKKDIKTNSELVRHLNVEKDTFVLQLSCFICL